MRRDLVFFVSGLGFGLVAGYFTFRALEPAPSVRETAEVAARPAGVESSSIGLDEEPSYAPLDEEEVARLEELASESPNDASVRAELGQRLMDSGLFGEAIPWLEQAVALAPEELDVRNRLAIAYLNQGRLDDAVAAYERTLEIAPDHPASLLGLGRIKLYVQQDFGGGLAMWERLLEVAPGSPEAASIREELEALKAAHSGG